jgi:hypothetical protein
MGLIIKLFCFVLVAGLAGLFVLKKPDGSPWLSVDAFMSDTQTIGSNMRDLMNKVKNTTANSEENTSNNNNRNKSIYRWKDVKGQWQFSDIPPTDQVAETILVSGNLNKDIAEKYTPPEEKTVETNNNEDDQSQNANIMPTTLSPEKISKLINDTKNIQKLMDDRSTQLNKQLP